MDRTRDFARTKMGNKALRRLPARRGKLLRPWPKLFRLWTAAGVGCSVSAVALLAMTVTSQSLAATYRFPPKLTLDPARVGQTALDNRYVNPLSYAHVRPERIDMGVDYSGTGELTAIGWARVTYVGTQNTGWPGAFIEYRLLHGYRAGRYVYYAEGVRPAREIHVGRVVRPGRVVAHLIRGWSSGIEVGWGAGIGTETLAEKDHQSNFPTRCGKNFSALIKSLGGPPGVP